MARAGPRKAKAYGLAFKPACSSHLDWHRCEADIPTMPGHSTRRSWLRPVLLGIRAQVYAFGCALVGTAVYAMYLAVQARGTPSQAAINVAAARWSPWVMALAGVVFTYVLGRRLARERIAGPRSRALMLGATSAAFSLIPVLLLHGRPGVRSLLIAACLVAAGWIGATVGTRPTAD